MPRSRKQPRRPEMFLARLHHSVSLLSRLARWLSLPLAALLFLQWPLRELIHAYSREANDMAQWISALYVSVAVSAATRTATHLSAQAYGHIHSSVYTSWRTIIGVVTLFLWGGYVFFALTPTAWRSLIGIERFAETLNPGYFLIKLAAVLLTVLVMLDAALDMLRLMRLRQPV